MYAIPVNIKFCVLPIYLISKVFVSGPCRAKCLNSPIQILTTLKRNLNMPVTCKIRLLNASQDTVELARRIEKAGVSALAVHGR